MTLDRSEQFLSRSRVNIYCKNYYDEGKSSWNDFVSVSCKHDAIFDVRAFLTLSRTHVNET